MKLQAILSAISIKSLNLVIDDMTFEIHDQDQHQAYENLTFSTITNKRQKSFFFFKKGPIENFQS